VTLKGYQAAINNEVVFSSDSQKIATSSYDGVIKVWNLNGQELFSTTGDTMEIEGGWYLSKITFNASSDIVAVASRDGTTRLYNLKGQEINRLKLLPRANHLTFTPDGKQLLISDDTTTGIWNIDNQSSSLINPKRGTISQIKYSPDGKILAVTGANESVQVWTLDGQKVIEFSGSWLIFSSDSKKLAAVGKNNDVQIYSLNQTKFTSFDFEQNKSISFNTHQNKPYKLQFNSKGNLLVTASLDNIIIWDITDNSPKKIATIDEAIVTNIRFTSDDSKLLLEGAHGISIWDLNGQLINRMNDSGSKDPLSGYKQRHNLFPVNNALFSFDGWTVAGNSTDGTLKLWSFNGQEIRHFPNHIPIALRFSPDGKILASSVVESKKGIVLWDNFGQKINHIRSKSEVLDGIEFSSDSQMIAAKGFDTMSATSPTVLYVWDLSGRLVSQFNSDSSPAAISPDWKTAATIKKKENEVDQSVEIWKMRTLDELIQSSCSKLKVFLLNQQGPLSQKATTDDRKICGLE
jgi:WD40 repeat protein